MSLLPFDQVCEVRTNPEGTLLGTVAGHVEVVNSASETARGERYDANGELEPDAAELVVGFANRQIVCEGTRYKVVSAVSRSYVPHVEVSLLELRPGG